MAVNTTADFNPDVGEIVEEAFERAGLEMKTGYDLRTARRSLDLMFLEWQNRGINLWAVDEEISSTLAVGTSKLTTTAGTISILETVLRENDGSATTQVDYVLGRISRDVYSAIPNKLTKGRPVQCYVERLQGETNIHLWPVPDRAVYKVVYWRIQRMKDSGPGGTYNPDAPDRFWPAVAAGLAYHIAVKRPEAAGRIQMLKQMYEEQFRLAADEDREKAPVRFYPGGYSSIG